MAEFSGKVIEAYFTNNQKDTIAVIWRDDEAKANSEFFVSVEPDGHYFKALLEEIPLEEIEEQTNKRAEVYMQELKRLVKRWSLSEPKDWDPAQIDRMMHNKMSTFVKSFNPKEKSQAETLFRIKLDLFEDERVKNSKDADEKSKLRKAEDPLEAFMAFAVLIGRLGKRTRK